MTERIDISRRLDHLAKKPLERILMINPQSEAHPEQASRYPIGLFSVATYLAENWGNTGLDINILDLQIQPTNFDIAACITDINPDVVMVTGITPYIPYAQRVGQIVREVKPEALTMVGGFHTTVKPEETMSMGNFDVGVVGEGEETALEVLQTLASHVLDEPNKLFSHNGLVFQKHDGQIVFTRPRIPVVPLSQYPWASKGLEFLIGQTAGYTVFGDTKKFTSRPGTIITSRGCPFSCANCGSKQMFPNVRNRLPSDVVGEIKYLHDRHGVKNFYFADDTINQNAERLREISRLLIQESLPIEWVGMARTDTLDEKLYKVAAKSGCVELAFGVESADEEVLEALGKKSGMQNVTDITQMVRDAGISVKYYLMVGNPQETMHSSETTAEYLEATHPDKIRVARAIPYPGTPFLRDIEVVSPYDKKYEDWWAFPPPSDPFGPLLEMTRTSLMSPEDIEAARQLLIKTHLGYGGEV